MNAGRPAFERVVLKLSGEAFAGPDSAVDAGTISSMAAQIAEVARDSVPALPSSSAY